MDCQNVLKIINDVGVKLNAPTITEENMKSIDLLVDCNFSSIDIMELAVELEKNLKIEIPVYFFNIQTFRSPKRIIDVINNVRGRI
ncbi:MAG: hypothetical protein HFE30_07940 [Clostridiales bacterium]|nr:hypothetical protein [Clostridiales bacterium]